MSDAPRVRLYCEGREEFVVLGKLAGILALPPIIDIAEPGRRKDRPTGIEGVVYDIAPELALPGTRSLAMLDLDNGGLDHVCAQFCRRLRSELPEREISHEVTSERTGLVRVSDGGAAAIVGIGLEADPVVVRFGIQWYAFDDYLTRLIVNERIYEATSQLCEFEHSIAMHKIDAIAGLMRENGKPLDKTKRILQMLMGIAGFRPSPATLAERLFGAAVSVGETALAVEMFQPLIGDIATAIIALSAIEETPPG